MFRYAMFAPRVFTFLPPVSNYHDYWFQEIIKNISIYHINLDRTINIIFFYQKKLRMPGSKA